MIHVQKVNHSFSVGKKDRKQILSVLRDVSFDVEKGEIVTIVGKSGSGKSTLLNLLSGFIRAESGSITIHNEDVTSFSEGEFADFRMSHIGFIFQNFQLIQSMTAYQNVELPLVIKGVEKSVRHQKTMEMLEKMGIVSFQDHYPSELSGGQQQRVSIARALINEPSLLLADEPTGSLDSETEKELLDLIASINQELGTTFLIITHDEEVARIGHRTFVIADGQLAEQEVPT